MKIFSRADAMKYTKDGILEIPEGFTDLDADFAYFVVREDLPKVHTVAIPKTVEHIDTMRGDCSQGPYGYANNPFCQIVVDRENKKFCSQDGILFSKDMKKLLCYPCGKFDKIYYIPEGVESIGQEAFLNVEHLQTIKFPDSLHCIEERAFSACEQLDYPDVVRMYQSCQGTIISIPMITGCNYQRNDKVCHLLLTEQSLESIREIDFTEYQACGMNVVSDYRNRREIMRRFWIFAEALDWVLDHNDLEERLTMFKNVFYCDEY